MAPKEARDPLGLIEAGRLSASDLEHPDLQPQKQMFILKKVSGQR